MNYVSDKLVQPAELIATYQLPQSIGGGKASGDFLVDPNTQYTNQRIEFFSNSNTPIGGYVYFQLLLLSDLHGVTHRDNITYSYNPNLKVTATSNRAGCIVILETERLGHSPGCQAGDKLSLFGSLHLPAVPGTSAVDKTLTTQVDFVLQ